MDLEKAINIYCGNIEEFSRRETIAAEQRIGSVNGLLSAILTERHMGVQEVFRTFKDMLPVSTYEDRARLCMALSVSPYHSSELKRNGIFSDDIAAGSHGKVSLVRNSYNELAFSRMSVVITRPKEMFVPSFISACEDVYDSHSEFCILPIENSQSGRLFNFYSMLDRYELKICSVCELEGDGASEGSVKYALVGRSLPDRIPKNSRWSFEFSLISENGRTLFDILQVAEIFGATLMRIDSLPVEYDGGLQKYYFTFGLPEANVSAFNLFLTEEYARYTAVGSYPVV